MQNKIKKVPHVTSEESNSASNFTQMNNIMETLQLQHELPSEATIVQCSDVESTSFYVYNPPRDPLKDVVV